MWAVPTVYDPRHHGLNAPDSAVFFFPAPRAQGIRLMLDPPPSTLPMLKGGFAGVRKLFLRSRR
jgi:hypothetical protein